MLTNKRMCDTIVSALGNCVMAARQTLTLFVRVQILHPQPKNQATKRLLDFFIHCESNGISSPLGVYHHAQRVYHQPQAVYRFRNVEVVVRNEYHRQRDVQKKQKSLRPHQTNVNIKLQNAKGQQMKTLYTAFKGKNNTSYQLVSRIDNNSLF